MNDYRSLLIGLCMAAMASATSAEVISPSERGGVSAPAEGFQLHPANNARLCASDTLSPTDSEATRQAVIDETFEGTYSGEACWLDPELLHRAFARQQSERFSAVR